MRLADLEGMVQLPDTSRHGTHYAYRWYGCRCKECRAVVLASVVALQARQAAQGLPEDDPRHGTIAAYTNWKCRCVRCKEASRAYQAERRRKLRAENS